MLIHEFTKNALEKIVIEITEYQGKKYLNLRIWYDASKGQNTDWQPSQKGITIAADKLQELLKGLKLAEEELKKGKKQRSLPDSETRESKKKKKKEFAGSNGEIPF